MMRSLIGFAALVLFAGMTAAGGGLAGPQDKGGDGKDVSPHGKSGKSKGYPVTAAEREEIAQRAAADVQANVVQMRQVLDQLRDNAQRKAGELMACEEEIAELTRKLESKREQRKRSEDDAKRITTQMASMESRITELKTGLAEQFRAVRDREAAGQPGTVEDKLDRVLRRLDAIERRLADVETKVKP